MGIKICWDEMLRYYELRLFDIDICQILLAVFLLSCNWMKFFHSKHSFKLTFLFRVQLEKDFVDYIHFKANVVSRKLEILLKDKEKPVDCIKFGSTYYGCDIIQSYILCNPSPVPLNFVTILDEGAEGEELVSVQWRSYNYSLCFKLTN